VGVDGGLILLTNRGEDVASASAFKFAVASAVAVASAFDVRADERAHGLILPTERNSPSFVVVVVVVVVVKATTANKDL